MNKRLVLFTSIFLSVLILAVAGVVVKTVAARQQITSISPELQSQIDTREAEYAARIQEANQRIQQLNEQINFQQSTKEPQTITPENAALIALQTTGPDEVLIKIPELVSYEGRSAYEVQVTDGVLYIDSVTSEILFNGVPRRITPEQAAEIAGIYLGGMDPRYSTVKMAISNGSDVFQVTFNDYIVYVDKFGNVVQAQVLQYTNNTTNQSGSSQVNASSNGHENDDDHDDDHD
jgi:uncharacterized membrane protein YkoI